MPRATKKFERMYNGWTAVERVNARLKVYWGVDDGNVKGARRFLAQVGLLLAVHAVFATLLAQVPRRCEPRPRKIRRSRSEGQKPRDEQADP